MELGHQIKQAGTGKRMHVASLAEPVSWAKPKNNCQFTGSVQKMAQISYRKRAKTEKKFPGQD
jgi:hypothetical protein